MAIVISCISLQPAQFSVSENIFHIIVVSERLFKSLKGNCFRGDWLQTEEYKYVQKYRKRNGQLKRKRLKKHKKGT